MTTETRTSSTQDDKETAVLQPQGERQSHDEPPALALVIVAAGASTRMGGQKKEYRPMPDGNGTVLSAAVEAFVRAIPHPPAQSEHPAVPARLSSLVVAIPRNSGQEGRKAALDALWSSPLLRDLWKEGKGAAPRLLFAEGGESRQASVLHALQSLEESGTAPHIVLVHDGARPFVSTQTILEVVAATIRTGAAACGVAPVDTQKEMDADGFILRHLDRSRLVAIQTPQGFLFKPLLEAHKKAAAQGFEATDDTAVWGEYVGQVHVTRGDVDNKKITFPSDLAPPATPPITKERHTMIRTGLGYDLHRLEAGRSLVLGGIAIPFHKGEAGHSDGDALLHAITDALLGAAALSDIGELFPPSESRWKGADSRQLLQAAWAQVQEAGWELGNLDCVVAIERPKILPHRQRIRESIASTLGVDSSQVFVKAKTGEGLGPVGREEAVEVWATCLLTKRES